jgi:acetyl-CoA carboxylase biotin carboxyl carrier protein
MDHILRGLNHNMWKDKLKEIIYLLEHSDVNEIEVNFWFKKIKVTKNSTPVYSSNPIQDLSIVPEEKVQENSNNTQQQVASDQSLITITSPMPGTFYSSPDPESSSFVNVGSKVKVGETLCIVEAMKIMNEIQSDINGEIVEIFVQNSQPVEYDSPLFSIKKLN